MNYRGTYDAGTSYDVGDVAVYTDNVAYELFQEAASGTTPHDKRYWRRVDQPLQEVVMMFHGMIVSMNDIISGLADGETGLSKMIAPEYTKTTYTKGDVRTHDGELYYAKQDIGTAENWTASHWQKTSAGAMIAAANTEIATNAGDIDDIQKVVASETTLTLKKGTTLYDITVDTTGDTPALDVTAQE